MSIQKKEGNRIIGLSGYAKSGKDTVGQYLVSSYLFRRVAFADNVRNGVYAMNPFVPYGDGYSRLQRVVDDLGWDVAKEEVLEIRRLLQTYGTEAGREIHGHNIWIDNLAHQVDSIIEHNHVVITDVRFDNELDYIEDCGGVVIRVDRDGVGRRFNHKSEDVPLKADYVVDNNGTIDELYVKIDSIMEELGMVKINVSRN